MQNIEMTVLALLGLCFGVRKMVMSSCMLFVSCIFSGNLKFYSEIELRERFSDETNTKLLKLKTLSFKVQNQLSINLLTPQILCQKIKWKPISLKNNSVEMQKARNNNDSIMRNQKQKVGI